MASSRDAEKGEPDEENRALLRARHEGRQDDGEHLNRANNMVLADFEKPGPSKINIADSNVKTEEPNQSEEADLTEGSITSEQTNDSEASDTSELKKSWDLNFCLIETIYIFKNEELISWLEDIEVSKACPISILRAACRAQSDEEALQILLDAGTRRSAYGLGSYTPLHMAALLNEPKSIAKILGFPEGLDNEDTDPVYIERRFYDSLAAFTDIPVGSTALHVASMCSNPQAVRVLLEAGANPNRRDISNSTPLDVAGASTSHNNVQSYVETLQLLLEYRGRLSKVKRRRKLALERALRSRSLQALKLLLNVAPFNPRNHSACTLMRLCVELRLQEHLEVLLRYHSSLEMHYWAVDMTDEEGSTVLHWTASEGWANGVTVALLAAVDITVRNYVGDTALHLAAKAGYFDIVKQILDHDLNHSTSKNYVCFMQNNMGESPYSHAIFSGNADIVKYMCHRNQHMQSNFNKYIGNLTALEYAAEKNFQDLFVLLLNECSVSEFETLLILYKLAKLNLPELYYKLAKTQGSKNYVEINIRRDRGILHRAIKNCSREMIIILLRAGADLSHKAEQTAISLLMYHMTKPTELMTEILDECINSSTDKNIYDKDCVITINYSVLAPDNNYEVYDNDDSNYEDLKTKANDMKVLEALIETGDAYDQRSLLTHPVVESFLYLKWKKCAKFIYILISAYVFFLTSLNIFIATMYYHLDHKIKEQDIPSIINLFAWRIITGVFTSTFICLVVFFSWFPCVRWKWRQIKFLIAVLPVLYKRGFFKRICLKLLSSLTKWRCYKTIWNKKLSVITKRTRLLLIVGGVKMICTPMDAADTDINRGIAVITVSLSWIYLMILLSWTPTFGYFMQMYGKVSRNIIKVMLSFSFPVVSFSICFMILLRSKEPFEGPIAAFLKTIVMMSSEFEYENLVKNKATDSPKDATNSTLDSFEDAPLSSVFMLRIFFLLFFICVAIVLMNLMLGAAVSDFQELAHDGKKRCLMKQIECISELQKLFQLKLFRLLEWTKLENLKVRTEEYITTESKIFGKEMKEIILSKAQSLKKSKEKKADDIGMQAKMYDIYDLIKEKMADDIGSKVKIDNISKKQSDLEKELLEIRNSVDIILEAVAQIKDASEKGIIGAVDKILEAIANEKNN